MPNLLLTGDLWTDAVGNSPPQSGIYWDGETYSTLTDFGVINGRLRFLGAPGADDRFIASVASSNLGGETITLQFKVGGVVQNSWPMVEGGTTVIDIDAQTGEFAWGSDGLLNTYPTLVITPTADPPPPPPPPVSYNCECDDDHPRTTLAALRTRLLRRLGFYAQGNPPPGMAALLDDFINEAQETLFRNYKVLRTERFFTWDLVAGVRFYDLAANRDVCTKELDPREITWAGISQGDDSWQEIGCGINPSLYNSNQTGQPQRYEVRQCIEVWPYPADATWQLRIKGHFAPVKMVADGDFTSIDEEAIFKLALANAKAHYGHSDAGNYAAALRTYIGGLRAAAHQTRRYLPGRTDRPMPSRPRLVE